MGPAPRSSVFISYRRADAGGWPGRIENDLIDRFGAKRVFRDVRIPAGVDYEEHIEHVLDGCDVLIAVVGPEWTTLSAADGGSRIDQPDDLLREEIERALRRPDVTVIPVLVGGAVMPAADDLPPSLQPLVRRQAIVLTDQSWDHDIGILVDRLSDLLGGGRRHLLRAPRGSVVVLATVSTVVAVATGMFTLRDTLFPDESGSAQASLAGYQRSVGRVCAGVNKADRAAATVARRLRRRLRGASTVLAQRDALLDAARRTNARSGHQLAQFQGLPVPPSLTQRHRATLAAWNLNQERASEYQRRLDGAGSSTSRLVASIRYLGSIRPALARGGIVVRAGLGNLGGARCKLDEPVVTDTITLPRLRRSATSGRPGTTGTQGDLTPPSPTTRGPGASQDVTPPADLANQDVTPPEALPSPKESVPPSSRLTPSTAPPPPAPSSVPDGETTSSQP